MSKVGDLYYEILFKDGTDKDFKAIEEKVRKLNTLLANGIDGSKIATNIQNALDKQTFSIKVNATVTGLDGIQQQMEQIASSAATAMANAANAAMGKVKPPSPTPPANPGKSPSKPSGESKSRQEEAERRNDPFARYLRNQYVVSDKGGNKALEKYYGERIARLQTKIGDIQKPGKGNAFGKEWNGKEWVWKQGAEDRYKSLLHDLNLSKAKLQMAQNAGKTTLSVTDIPQKGSAAEKIQKEALELRRAGIRSAFMEQAKAEKQKNDLIKKGEREVAAIRSQNDAAEMKRQRNLYAELSRQNKERIQAEQKMSALMAQGTAAKAASRRASYASNGNPAYNSYAAGMEEIRRKAIQSAWDVRRGVQPQYNASQIAAMSQRMSGWLQQYNAVSSSSRSLGAQIGNMSQVLANNPGRANAISTQIALVRQYQSSLQDAARTYTAAMGGDAAARATLAKGAFSPMWLQQVQKNAKAAGDAVRHATSGMQVTNYASNLRQVAEELANVQSRGSRVAEVLGGVFSAYAAKEFFDKLVQIGGEFEKQKLALASMFNSQTKADTLYSQIQSLAVKSPFTFGELTSYTKQMSAYGIQYKDIYETTKRLADISAGVGVPMSRIILAYGQVSTAHFLRGQELRQFTEAGIPLVDALAKRFSKLKGEMVSADDVFDMISKRAVSFEDVKAVIDEMTDKGGRFYNMQDVLSESLSGKWSNLQDSIEIMYSEMENSNKGILKGIVEGLTAVVRSWHTLMPIGTGLLAVYAALVTKQKLWNVLTVKSSARDAKIIADANARAEALERETEAYNRQTAAVNANSTSREKNALVRQGYRMAANGGDPSAIMAASNGLITKEGGQYGKLVKTAWLSSRVRAARAELDKARGITANLSKSFDLLKARGKLAFVQMTFGAQSFGAALMGIFNWTNALMAALFIGISAWMSHEQKVDEMNEHMKESVQGMKDTYKELSDFIKANPIELTIAEGNANKISELYKSYKEKIENAPIDLSFVVQNAEQLPEVGDKLRYMRTELENLTLVTNQYQTVAAATTKAIADETDEVLGEDLGTNLKDYMNAVRDFEAEKMKLNTEDYEDSYDKMVNRLFVQLNLVDSKTRDAIKARWAQASVEIKKALNKGDIEEYLNLINRWNTQNPNIRAQLDPYLGTSVVGKQNDMDDAYDTMVADIQKSMPIIENALRQGHEQIVQENGKIVEGEAYTLNKLTDQGYQALLTLLQDYVNSGKWSKEEMDAYLTYIEERAQAAPNATWNTNTRMFHAFLDNLKSNYKKEFEGAEFTGQFSKSQQEAFKQAINDLPAQYKHYEAEFLKKVQNMGDKIKGIIADALDMSGAPGMVAFNKPEEIFDRLSKKKGRNSAVWKKTMAIAAPHDGESYEDWLDRLSKGAIEQDEREYTNKNTRVRTAAVVADQKDAANKKRNYMGTLWEVNPVLAAETEAKFKSNKDKDKQDKKDAQNRKKQESEANKAEQERLKKLRDRLSRLQDIKSVYKKMADIYGETDALERMRNSSLFAADGIPREVRGTDTLNQWISEEMGKVHDEAGTKTTEQRSVGESAQKAKLDIDIEIDRSNFDKEVKQLERDLKKNEEQWERYMAFREIGVSQEQSVRLTFGDGSKPTTETDYRRAQAAGILRQNNVNPANVDQILKMDKDQLTDYFMGDSRIVDKLNPVVEAYQNAWQEVVKKNDEMYKELVKNAKDYDDQISDLNAEHDRKEEAISQGQQLYEKTGGMEGLSPESVTRLRAANQQDYNKKVGDVQLDRLRNSESYLNFFNAVTAMTVEEATRIGEAIRDQLNAKLQDGTISAKDYADEIEKINEQMDKVRTQKTEGQATWQGGLKGRVEWQKQNAQDRWNAANNAYGQARKDYDKAQKEGDEEGMGKAAVEMWKKNIERGKAGKDLEKAKEREERMENVSAGIGKFASTADSLSKFRDSLGETITSFGGDTDSAGFQTFSTVVDSVGALASGAQDVMQKMMSGDFVGAAFSAITAPLNVITAFNKLHDQKLQRQIELSEKRSAEIKSAADQIQHAIENSLGTEAAKEDALEAYGQLKDQMGANGAKKQFGDSYASIYDALSDADKVREMMQDMKQGSTLDEMDNLLNDKTLSQMQKNLLKSLRDKTNESGTGGLTGKDYRNQEEYAALQKEGFDTTDSISAYGAEYLALLEQRKELENRMDLEEQKKNTDQDKISDYKDQLSDLNNQIREFKDTMLKDLLGMDFKSFADNLAQNLTNAFKSGQDAAEAFTSTVNDMLATITQNAIKNAVIMPYVNQLKKDVEDAYDINDPDSIDKVVDVIYNSEDKALGVIADAQKIWDQIDRKTNGSLSSTGSTSSNTLQGSSKSLSEDKGNLLASYLNAIRADVSIERGYFEKLMKESLPKMDLTMEAQLQELSAIAKHTALIVESTEANAAAAKAIKDTLNSVVTVGSGGKAVRVK